MEGAVEFEETSVSRVHAVLQWREEHACYELSNRSFTNPARGTGLLTDGAQFQLGTLVAEVRRAGVTPEPFMGYLEVVQGPGTGSRYEVRRRRLELGRSARCEICIPSYALAQEHAILEWYGDQPLLMPTTSGPVLVNGKPIPRGAFLEPHDAVSLAANVSLRWLPGEEEPAAEEPAPTGAVEEAAPAPAPPVRRRWKTASLPARAAFFTTLLGRLEAREPIQRAVEEAATACLPRLAPELRLEGRSLSEALGRFPHCFTSYEIGMVAAGEEAGILEAQLGVLAASLRCGVAWRRRVARVLLPATGALVLAALAAGLLVPLGIAAAGALLLRVAHYVLTRFSGYRRVEEDVVERLPRLGPVLRLRTGGRFLRALGPLLQRAARTTRWPWWRRRAAWRRARACATPWRLRGCWPRRCWRRSAAARSTGTCPTGSPPPLCGWTPPRQRRSRRPSRGCWSPPACWRRRCCWWGWPSASSGGCSRGPRG